MKILLHTNPNPPRHGIDIMYNKSIVEYNPSEKDVLNKSNTQPLLNLMRRRTCVLSDEQNLFVVAICTLCPTAISDYIPVLIATMYTSTHRLIPFPHFMGWGWFMVFNATFNNISLISWRSVLLVGETEVLLKKTHRSVAYHWQLLSQNVVPSVPRHGRYSNSHCDSFFVELLLSLI